jgi:hypothetical protein
MGRGTSIAVALVLIAGLGADAEAQSGPGGAFYVNFVVADAVGDLGTVVDRGYGLELGAGLPIAAEGLLRLRADGGFSVYGLEHIHYCDYGCRVGSTLTTANSVFYGGVGPEMVFGAGPIRPYAHASAGLSWFVTSSSVDDNSGYGPYLETTNFSDTVFAWRFGGGLRFGVGSGPIFVDLGVTYHNNQVTTYLTRGDIVDNPDGTITMYPNQSDADLLSFKVGISIEHR